MGWAVRVGWGRGFQGGVLLGRDLDGRSHHAQ